MRYFIEIQYKGTAYNGWQSQINSTSIQDILNRCLSLKLNSEINCTGCGRTDTGVHAKQFFAHFDYEKSIPPALLKSINIFLPKDIVVLQLIKVKEATNARFDARNRTYKYFIHLNKSPFLIETSTYFHQPLNFELMNKAASFLIGSHSFEAFSKVSKDETHHLSDVMFAQWTQLENQWVFTIKANRFLRGMVRIVVGSLLSVGTGKISIKDFQQILKSKDRKKASAAAPAQGLYLWEVEYDWPKIIAD